MANSHIESLSDDFNSHGRDKEKLLPTSVKRMKLQITVNIGLGFKKRVIWKLVLFFMAMFFFAAAYVQHNDPDPYLWMPVYLLPFLMNFLFLFYLPALDNRRFWKWFNLTIVIHICYCFFLGFLTIVGYATMEAYLPLLPSTMSESNMTLEEGKELLGLCLVIAWLAFLYDANFLKSGKRGIVVATALTGLPILAWIYVERIEEENANECS